MKSNIIKIKRNSILRNIAIVATGTAAAQSLSILFSPLITRIYGPNEFGLLGVFLAMVSIISPIAALTYPTAIVLPKEENEAKGLIRLSLYTAGIFSLITALTLVFFKNTIVSMFQISSISNFLYLLPFLIMSSSLSQVTEQWMIRTKRFKLIGKVTFLSSLIMNISKVGLGWFHPIAAVLVVISVLGNTLHAFMLLIGDNLNNLRNILQWNKDKNSKIPLKALAKKYIDFPVYRAPQVLLNAVSQSIPVLFLSIFFSPASAGFYSLSKTVLAMPIGFLGKSIGDVFYPRIAEAANDGENIKDIITRVTFWLILIGIFPFGVIIIFGPSLFSIVFGENWIQAGEYARWLSLWLFFMFINRPSVIAIPILRLQGAFLIFEIISVLIKVLALYIGFFMFRDDIIAVALYSIAGVLTYIYLILWVIRSSGKFPQCK